MSSEIKLYANKELYATTVTSPGLNLQLVPLVSDESNNIEAVWDKIVTDPFYNSLFLSAEQLIPANYNATTGMTKYKKSDYTLTDADWDEVEYGFAGNWFLVSKDNTTEEVVTTGNLEINRAVVIRFMVFPSESIKDQVLQLKFGQYTLKVFRNGYCSLYLTTGSVFKSDGYIVGGFERIRQYEQDLAGRLVTLYILPYRRNSIMVMSTLGGGFLYVDKDIDATTYGTITDAAPFKFICYGKGFIQVMPATYPASGSFSISKFISHNPTGTLTVTSTKDEPDDSEITVDETPTLAVVGESEYTEFTAETTIAASTDKKYTPFIYGIRYTWTAVLTTAALSNEYEVTKWRAESMKISLSDSPSGRQLSFILDNETLIDFFDGKSNRTMMLQSEEGSGESLEIKELFLGLSNMPELTDIACNELSCTVSDYWKKLENFRIPMNLVCDGLVHTDIIRKLLNSAGIPDERINIATDTYTLPKTERTDEAALEYTAGTTIADIITNIADEYTGWKVGFQPIAGVVKFVYIPVDQYASIVKTYYLSPLNRTMADVILTDSYKITYIEPEATMIRLIGETEDGEPIIGEYIDEDAEDSTLSESNRPENWVGERRYVGIRNNALTTAADVTKALQILVDRLTRRRKFIEFSAYYDISVWPNYLVTIDTIGTFRIKSCEININSIYYNDYIATYVAEEYVEGVN